MREERSDSREVELEGESIDTETGEPRNIERAATEGTTVERSTEHATATAATVESKVEPEASPDIEHGAGDQGTDPSRLD